MTTAVRELAERTSTVHLFEAYSYTESALSKTELESQGGDQLLKRRCGDDNRPSMSFRAKRGNPINRNAPFWRLSSTALVLAITNRAENLAISSSKDKNSNPISAKLSAW